MRRSGRLPEHDRRILVFLAFAFVLVLTLRRSIINDWSSSEEHSIVLCASVFFLFLTRNLWFRFSSKAGPSSGPHSRAQPDPRTNHKVQRTPKAQARSQSEIGLLVQ